MHDPRTRLVADGYDLMGERFAEWRARIRGDPRLWWAEQLTSRLEDGARVLDLGCGAGVPDTQLLAERFRVTGVDISAFVAGPLSPAPAGKGDVKRRRCSPG